MVGKHIWWIDNAYNFLSQNRIILSKDWHYKFWNKLWGKGSLGKYFFSGHGKKKHSKTIKCNIRLSMPFSANIMLTGLGVFSASIVEVQVFLLPSFLYL